MTPRPILIVSGIVTLSVIAVVVYFWVAGEDKVVPLSSPDQSLSAPSGSSVQSTNTDAQSLVAGDDSRAGANTESIDTLMHEVEQTAAGDDTALEDELAGENESFMEGAVVMEQLGQSYDETSY